MRASSSCPPSKQNGDPFRIPLFNFLFTTCFESPDRPFDAVARAGANGQFRVARAYLERPPSRVGGRFEGEQILVSQFFDDLTRGNAGMRWRTRREELASRPARQVGQRAVGLW